MNSGTGAEWRISPSAFGLSPPDILFFEQLGGHLLKFCQALNRLYLDSLRGTQSPWIHGYLDQGKPEGLLEFARMKRFRDALPDVIRPDIIPTETGLALTELDSVPGGIGMTGSLTQAYSAFDDQLVGKPDGMVQGFASMLRHRLGQQTGVVAIVVSDEAEDYRAEMTWIASHLRALRLETYCLHPREIQFTEDGLFAETFSGKQRIGVIYRFFELFDLKNIAKSELIMYAAKKGKVVITPPFKPWMEEKLALGLLHHPRLASFWGNYLGAETFSILINLVPYTWILDPRPLPPTAIIPHLRLNDQAVSDWRDLSSGSQRQREFVIKPSGFSPMAWGSRGVVVGHDLSQPEWNAALDQALAQFRHTPSVLQNFHKGRRFDLTYVDDSTGAELPMAGRVRLSPYYFVVENEAKLGGILATACPKDKKVIHGMRDAIMAPCTRAPV